MNFQKFYKEREAYFDSGIVREIYSSEKVCVCSVANLSYVLFNYTKNGNGSHIGLMINKEHVRLLLEDEKNFLRLLSNVSPEDMKKSLFILGNSNFLPLKKLKEERDIIGPSSNIDFDMEAELMSKNKSR